MNKAINTSITCKV